MRDDWKPWTFDQTDLSTGPDPDWTPEEREIAAAQMRGDLPTITDLISANPIPTLAQEPEEIVEARLLYDRLGVPYDYAVTSDGYDPASDSYKLRFTVTPKRSIPSWPALRSRSESSRSSS